MNETQKPGETPKLTPEQRRKQRMQERRRKRNASVAAVLCFVAAIAIMGTYTFRDYKRSKRELEQAKNQVEELELQNAGIEDLTPDASKETNTDSITNQEDESEKEDENQAENTQKSVSEKKDAESHETVGAENKVSFQEGDKLFWPVEGALLMDYSMDKAVYFSTLDQFRYNPALVISGEKGDQVISSAPGIVKSIDKTAQTGTTVNVDIGGGYELFYGQLGDVQVKTGDYVDSKTVLGYVTDPTMYYSVEGSNVYFEMRKDGQPVNPMDYLVE